MITAIGLRVVVNQSRVVSSDETRMSLPVGQETNEGPSTRSDKDQSCLEKDRDSGSPDRKTDSQRANDGWGERGFRAARVPVCQPISVRPGEPKLLPRPPRGPEPGGPLSPGGQGDVGYVVRRAPPTDGEPAVDAGRGVLLVLVRHGGQGVGEVARHLPPGAGRKPTSRESAAPNLLRTSMPG